MNAKTIEKQMIHFRRELHQFPELSSKEYNTQKRIIEMLEEHNIEYDITDKTGVIGYINKSSKGTTVAIRADIDALPITEQNDVDYKSKNDGVMHACGHDVHTTILMGTGILLNNIKGEIKGTVKLIFQPDEEVSGGARRIVQEGFLEDVDYVLGLHVQPYIEVGEIEVKKGHFNAETGGVKIEISGKSAHAAYPERGIDSIVVASQLINHLQSIFTRDLSPLTQSVLTFGKIYGGTKSNIVADKVTIEGTLRTLEIETREKITNRIKEVCEGMSISTGSIITPNFYKGYPSLYNDENLVDIITNNASQLESIKKVNIKKHPSLGGEDFGYYQEKATGAFFHLGCGNTKENIISSLHTETFNIDENCIAIGIDLQVMNVLSILNGK